MKLSSGLHLAYCTNIHRGETWDQTFDSLKRYALAVRRQVCPSDPYAIGLRLGQAAAQELSCPETLASFRRWLDQERCYVFTINGFPYGNFHGSRVKEGVYRPDWTTVERLEYTKTLFDLLAELVTEEVEGSVSTVPVSFKDFIADDRDVAEAGRRLWQCVDHIERCQSRSGRRLHLDLEPEPLCWLETSEETVRFFERMERLRPGDSRLYEFLGVNYDCCHLAVEFERPEVALDRFRDRRIRIGKIHLSSALKLVPTREALEALKAFADDVWLHQVVERLADGRLRRYRDLPEALAVNVAEIGESVEEWRVHFHLPLHASPTGQFEDTTDHLRGSLDYLRDHPGLCSLLEMETYTWEMLPPELKSREVVDQLVEEYRWTLLQLADRGLA